MEWNDLQKLIHLYTGHLSPLPVFIYLFIYLFFNLIFYVGPCKILSFITVMMFLTVYNSNDLLLWINASTLPSLKYTYFLSTPYRLGSVLDTKFPAFVERFRWKDYFSLGKSQKEVYRIDLSWNPAWKMETSPGLLNTGNLTREDCWLLYWCWFTTLNSMWEQTIIYVWG